MKEQEAPLVLHVIPSLDIGGTESQLVQFINRSSHPDRHVVAVFDELGHLADQIPKPPVDIGSFGRRPQNYIGNLKPVRRLRKLITRLEVDILHAHLGVGEVLGRLAAPRAMPFVASRRGRNLGFERSRLLKMVEGLSHRRVDLLLCNSRYLEERSHQNDLWCPPTRVIYNAIDSERFQPTGFSSLRSPTVAMVANQKWYKRQELFLRSIRVVVSTYPSMRAILVGDGPDHDSLIGLARKLGIDQNVEFVSRALDVRPYLAKAHLVALTSTHEGFPNALLEGMAMGRPVVATRVGGIPELVREGTDGLLVDPDPEALANSMLSIVGNRSRLESMSRNAIARAHQFGWDRLVREMEDAYREVRVARNRKQRRGTPSPQPR